MLDDAGSQAALDRLAVAPAEHATDDGVNPPANAWIITVRVQDRPWRRRRRAGSPRGRRTRLTYDHAGR